MGKNSKPKFYAKVEFTYGDCVYIPCWNRTWNAAVKDIKRDFVLIWKITEIKESTYKRNARKVDVVGV